MEQITLYHRDEPITCYPLNKNSFSIGSSPDNDLVLAGDRVSEHHMVLFRTHDGTWRTRNSSESNAMGSELTANAKIPIDSFSILFERTKVIKNKIEPEAPPDLGMVGASQETRILKRNILKLAPLSAPVLITGETGTGKELVSAGLHRASARSDGPFVVVNCGGLTDTLLEDTLFGHRRGAFTGATRDKTGVFEQANGGTLFLDEIGELPRSQQAALLRVLDDQNVRRIGDDRAKTVDFRLVTATNQDLARQIENGAFRSDLYHRISTIRLTTTPLRHRLLDLPPLSEHFLNQMVDELGFKRLHESALEKLQSHDWPGNVRELRNVLFRASAFCRAQTIYDDHIDFQKLGARTNRKQFALNRIPMIEIDRILASNGGNVTATAKELEVPRSSLRDKLNRVYNTKRAS